MVSVCSSNDWNHWSHVKIVTEPAVSSETNDILRFLLVTSNGKLIKEGRIKPVIYVMINLCLFSKMY